ncbi:hypothetical protein, partial [Streptomyces sp. NPDC001680]
FGSLDAGNAITVDKPSAFLWPMELSVSHRPARLRPRHSMAPHRVASRGELTRTRRISAVSQR